MPRRLIKIVLWTVAATIVLPALLVLAVDPFQVIHRPFLRPLLFIDNDRYQDAGLIRQYLAHGDEFDSVVIGTSMSEGFRSLDTGVALGGRRALRLTIRGGNAEALALLGNAALATGKVRHVFWEVYRGYWDPTWMEKLQRPAELYTDRSAWGLRYYVFNHDAVVTSIAILKGTQAGVRDFELLHDEGSRFATASREFSSPESLAKLRKEIDPAEPLRAPAPPPNAAEIERAIRDGLFGVIDAHPDATYALVFPPTSYLDLARRGTLEFARRELVLRLLAAEAGKRPNVALFGFDTVSCIGGDLRNYRDYNHFLPEVTGLITAAVRAGRNRITPETVGAYIERTESQVLDWRAHFIAGASGYEGQPLSCVEAAE